MRPKATFENAAKSRYADVIKAHDEGETIQYKVSHRYGYVDYSEEDYPVHFIVRMGISYRVKPMPNCTYCYNKYSKDGVSFCKLNGKEIFNEDNKCPFI